MQPLPSALCYRRWAVRLLTEAKIQASTAPRVGLLYPGRGYRLDLGLENLSLGQDFLHQGLHAHVGGQDEGFVQHRSSLFPVTIAAIMPGGTRPRTRMPESWPKKAK